MEIGELIKKYELKRKTVSELIQISETEEYLSRYVSSRRILNEIIDDLKDLASYEYENKHQDFDCEDDANN